MGWEDGFAPNGSTLAMSAWGSFASLGPCLRYVRLAGNSGNASFLLMASRSMIQVVRGPAGNMSGGKGVGWLVERSVGVFDSSPPAALESPRQMLSQCRRTAQDGDQHLPEGVGQVDSSQIQKVGGEKSPSHSGVGCLWGKVSGQVAAMVLDQFSPRAWKGP
jgi:hypothetical protein